MPLQVEEEARMLLMQLQLCSSQQQAPAQHTLCGSAAKDAAVQKYLTAGRQVGAAQSSHQQDMWSLMMLSRSMDSSNSLLMLGARSFGSFVSTHAFLAHACVKHKQKLMLCFPPAGQPNFTAVASSDSVLLPAQVSPVHGPVR